jgi:ATP-dependent RNA helicase RhlE
VADIEKLIKKQDRARAAGVRGRPPARPHQRRPPPWREEGEAGDARDVLDSRARERARSIARRGGGRPHRAPSAPRDPFFEQPYERRGAKPRRRGKPPPRPRRARGISSNIKTKRKVAALFKSAEPS